MSGESSTSTESNTRSPVDARTARVLRPWRIALVIYGLALTTATHWPRLRLSPEIPTSDKVIHMLAFAMLTLLLWRSAWLGPRWLAAIVALAWASIDEVSQGIPALRRTVSWHDLVANICGVISAMALLWAMRRIPNDSEYLRPSEVRARLFAFTFDEMFSRSKPWLIGGVVASVTVAIILGVRPYLSSPQAVGTFGIIAFIVALHVLYFTYRFVFFREYQRVLADMPCMKCGAPGSQARLNESDGVECGVCKADRNGTGVRPPSRVSYAAIARVSLFPAAIALGGLAVLFGMVLVLPHVYGWMLATPSGRGTMPRLGQVLGRLPPSLTTVIDLTVYMLLIAVVIRAWRKRFAAYVDRAVRCRNCGHDLHGTPINERGKGHCGECGTPFNRFTPEHVARIVQAERETAEQRG
jgi:hypothetical protein